MIKQLLNDKFELPADGYYHLVPKGEYPAKAEDEKGKPLDIVQVLDDVAIGNLVNSFKSLASDAGFAGLPVDFDHKSLDPRGSTRASGWIMDLQPREDGLYAKIRWSNSGSAAVSGGDFRWPSPVFAGDSLESLGKGRVRPTVLLGAGLTNDPNLKTLKPLSNRNQKGVEMADKPNPKDGQAAGDPGACDPAAKTDKPLVNAVAGAGVDLAPLSALLGLKPEATVEEIAAAVQALLKDKADDQAEKDLAEFPNVENRAAVKQQLIANRAGTLAVLRSMPKAPAGNPVPNRAGGKLPDSSTLAKEEDAAEAVRCAKIRNRAGELQKTMRLSYNQAWERAEAEFPENEVK